MLLLAAAAPPLVAFPGPQTSVRSPVSTARVYYVDRGADRNGQNLSLRFDPGTGRFLVLKRVDRSVDVGWSPAGTRFLINDHIGSNIADCLIVRPAGAGVQGVSLLRIIARSPGRPRERPYDDHYYVRCARWISDTVVEGAVTGHTDEAGGGRDFNYPFTYDARANRIAWRR
jgi:hypothetical protein